MPVKSSSRSGNINGLRIELVVPEPSSLFSLASSSGITVRVTNQSSYPKFNEGVLVPNGFQSNIEIRRVFSSHLEAPYSSCTKNIDENFPSPYVPALIKNGYCYTQQTCFLMCFQKYLIGVCGCYDHITLIPPSMYLNTTGIRPCANFTDTLCDGNVRKAFIFDYLTF